MKNSGQAFFRSTRTVPVGDLIKINAGGYRMPSSVETLKEKVVDEYGNIRSEEQGYMNGGDVFNFVIREIPRDIKKIAEWAEVDIQSLDYYVFHQANNFYQQLSGQETQTGYDEDSVDDRQIR